MAPAGFASFETSMGFCAIAWSEKGVLRFQLPVSSRAEAEQQLLARLSATEGRPPLAVQAIIDAVQHYYAGEAVDFSGVVIDLGERDRALQDIYAAARTIGWGGTTTYGELARSLDAGPEGARDVGRAMATNPVPLIIPCHRVLAAGGKLGGFSAPGGPATKRRMLALEGIHLSPPKPVQQSLDL